MEKLTAIQTNIEQAKREIQNLTYFIACLEKQQEEELERLGIVKDDLPL